MLLSQAKWYISEAVEVYYPVLDLRDTLQLMRIELELE